MQVHFQNFLQKSVIYDHYKVENCDMVVAFKVAKENTNVATAQLLKSINSVFCINSSATVRNFGVLFDQNLWTACFKVSPLSPATYF